MDQQQDKLFGNVIKTAILWAVLQLVCGWRNFWDAVVPGYDLWTWVTMALYILVLLALDISIFRLGTFSVAKGWAKYWAFSGAALLLARFYNGTDVAHATLEMILMFITPYYAVSPIWSLFGGRGYTVVILVLCVVHLIGLCVLARRAKKV